MTRTQRDYLATIDALHAHMGYSPTMREIALERDVRLQAVADIVIRLERDGFIVRNRNKARTMRLTEAGRMALKEQG